MFNCPVGVSYIDQVNMDAQSCSCSCSCTCIEHTGHLRNPPPCFYTYYMPSLALKARNLFTMYMHRVKIGCCVPRILLPSTTGFQFHSGTVLRVSNVRPQATSTRKHVSLASGTSGNATSIPEWLSFSNIAAGRAVVLICPGCGFGRLLGIIIACHV